MKKILLLLMMLFLCSCTSPLSSSDMSNTSENNTQDFILKDVLLYTTCNYNGTEYTCNYFYDSAGRLVSEEGQQYIKSDKEFKKRYKFYRYDRNNLVIEMLEGGSPKVFNQTLYEYDDSGNLVVQIDNNIYDSKNEENGDYYYFYYDENNRLTKKYFYLGNESNNYTYDYSYEGSKLIGTYKNELLETFYYDDKGRVIKHERGRDTTTMKYNDSGDLVEEKLSWTADGNQYTYTNRYEYNDKSQIIKHIYESNTAGKIIKLEYLYYYGDVQAAEIEIPRYEDYIVSKKTDYSNFTNKYGTPTTKCHHSDCNNYIAYSGDTWDCVKHACTCLNCGKYIDCDAVYCMDCIEKALSN